MKQKPHKIRHQTNNIPSPSEMLLAHTWWKVALAKKDISVFGVDESKIVKYLYRPFDFRYIYYAGNTRGFISMPRKDIMQHLLKDNLALFVGRAGQAVGNEDWDLVLCGDTVEDYNLFRRGNNACLPIYIYAEEKNEPEVDNLLQEPLGSYRSENFTSEFRSYINELYSYASPEEILGYIYAVLNCSLYRKKYSEFLKIDFPRIPFTEDKDLFTKLSGLGLELIDAHLMKAKLTSYKRPAFLGKGEGKVEDVSYNEAAEKLFINGGQSFAPVPSAVWNFHIGGYQVLAKYLKDRKGRILNGDEVRNIEEIVKILSFTVDQMAKIDALTKAWI